MDTSIHQRRARRSVKSRAPLQIVFVYEGFTDLIRAYELWSGLVTRFKNDMQLIGRAWNFSLLRDPRLRLKAALHTAEAQMIVLSASGRSELPAHMRTWIRAWTPWKKGRRDALVAVLDRQTPARRGASDVREYLRRTATQCGTDFFCNSSPLAPLLELGVTV